MANELMNIDQNMAETGAWTSLDLSTPENKKRVYNVISAGADEPIGDHLNEVLQLVDVYVENVACNIKDAAGNKTGEVDIRPRIVLFTADGKSYGCVSKGIYKSLADLFRVFGAPADWDEPMSVMVYQKSVDGRRISALKLV